MAVEGKTNFVLGKAHQSDASLDPAGAVELSIVMPCLNEAETLDACIEKAQRAIRECGVTGEIIIADNGSTDGSQALARAMGARVVQVEGKGYGNALRAGIASARGRHVVMGDADDSYDFAEIPLFIRKLREGYDVVMGNRFKGGIKPGAMRPLHRYLGNPVLTRIARILFNSPCGDNHCGLRGFRRDSYALLGLRAKGWEFGSEMLVKANLLRMRITEVPTTLSPDGRSRPPHLRTWEAGWRHLRLMLLYSPRWLFFYPGILLLVAGLAVGLWLVPHPRTVGRVTLDVHTLLYAATAILLGFQAILTSVFAKIYAIREGILPEDRRFRGWTSAMRLETGLLVGIMLLLLGLAGSFWGVSVWQARHFGPMDPVRSLRIVIPSVTAMALGGELILSSFFLGIVNMGQK